jgi:predicted  nucleic acid-binding Zn-ribbon protein
MTDSPERALVERLNNAEHLYDEVVQQTELHHLHTDAAEAIERLVRERDEADGVSNKRGVVTIKGKA